MESLKQKLYDYNKQKQRKIDLLKKNDTQMINKPFAFKNFSLKNQQQYLNANNQYMASTLIYKSINKTKTDKFTNFKRQIIKKIKGKDIDNEVQLSMY